MTRDEALIIDVMLNPESVMLNLFQHLFRAGLVQHLIYVAY